jgi:hypothetical protein
MTKSKEYKGMPVKTPSLLNEQTNRKRDFNCYLVSTELQIKTVAVEIGKFKKECAGAKIQKCIKRQLAAIAPHIAWWFSCQ